MICHTIDNKFKITMVLPFFFYFSFDLAPILISNPLKNIIYKKRWIVWMLKFQLNTVKLWTKSRFCRELSSHNSYKQIGLQICMFKGKCLPDVNVSENALGTLEAPFYHIHYIYVMEGFDLDWGKRYPRKHSYEIKMREVAWHSG